MLISVVAERQIGQLGREPCVLEVTEIFPSGLTSPCTFVNVSAVHQPNRCYLPGEHSLLTPSIIRNFSQEFIRHYHRGCRNCREAVLPVMRDFDEATRVFTYSLGRAIP